MRTVGLGYGKAKDESDKLLAQIAEQENEIASLKKENASLKKKAKVEAAAGAE